MESPKQLDEAAIVRRIKRAAAQSRKDNRLSGIVVGIGDDAAIWRPRTGFETILTTDWFLEGTHFWKDWHPPEAIGWKSVMRASSDTAAMGGVPKLLLLSMALPKTFEIQWLDRFLRGLTRASAELHCPLAGGDTTAAGTILINVTVVGEVRRGKALRRCGARPGDLLYVSGRLGEAEAGLKLARKLRRAGRRESGELLKKHLFPEARIAVGQWLGQTAKATAAMDLSDGLALDLHRLCAASGVGAVIHGDKLPMASFQFAKAFSESERRTAAIYGGDDYELLFCVPSRFSNRIPDSKAGVALTCIGQVTDSSEGITIVREGKRTKLIPRGWDPFRKDTAKPKLAE